MLLQSNPIAQASREHFGALFVAYVVAGLVALLLLGGCSSVPVSEMSDTAFQGHLAEVHNTTAKLAHGWLLERESDLDELLQAIALLKPSNGAEITPEELAAMESQGLVGSVISVALGDWLAGVEDPGRWREIVGAFVRGLETAVRARLGGPAPPA